MIDRPFLSWLAPTEPPSDVEVVVVGGGMAGGSVALALARAGRSVLVLEHQDDYRDKVRGEMLSPWGVEEAERFGVADALYAAEPLILRRWIQWDELYHPDEAPVVNLTETFVPTVEGPFSISHYRMCREFVGRAARAGAAVVMSVRDVCVETGPRPRVSYTDGDVRRQVTCKLVIGAGGRNMPVGRQLGIRLGKTKHHWGGGLMVTGMDDWPSGVQAMGTEGNVMFFVFPQVGNRARLYLNFPTEDRMRFAGPQGTKRFLEAFDLKCLPYRDIVLGATPAGACMTSPSLTTWTDELYREGVVLVGDEAGSNDPVLGTGLSNSLRDARIVTEIMLASSDWSPRAFEPYAVERRERMRKLNFCADLLGRLSAEFGAEARERRRIAWARMRQNPNYMVVLQIAMAGPDRAVAFGFSDFLVERLFAPERSSTVRSPRIRPRVGV